MRRTYSPIGQFPPEYRDDSGERGIIGSGTTNVFVLTFTRNRAGCARTMTEPSQSIAHDSLLELLAHPQRRRIVRHVAAADGPTPEDELVESLADSAGETHTRSAIAAHHRHLPKLEAYGVVDRGACERTVHAGSHLNEAVSLLERIEGSNEGLVHERL